MGGVLRFFSHDRCRLVGWLDRSSRGCSQSAGLVGRAEGVAGPWANERASGQRWVGHQWAERSEGQGVMG